MAAGGLATLTRSAPILAAYAGWRVGLPAAGRRLVAALTSSDADVHDLAAVLVGRSGEAGRGLLLRALEEPAARPTALLLLADLGDPDLARAIEPFTHDPDPRVARAAREALRTLELAPPTPTPR